ncbi:MarR family transcriptional regulator [Jatrophihabitans cynanchi]|jgi:DNA-binding MarR family transcriptional regulator|uniref:MarR family transcriptional regulator n=1 Tax=Jatrophihabitans cynanchi TaxID=2944128 RepID=A0ABY7K2W1_9ACTN|nr:MarR family transcriptional regulator [Jatrophihabitans sp. SB3-54]WAX59142.1 MarR family transcriptional regulator [Jatrophihabitans sp. SB3-54]
MRSDPKETGLRQVFDDLVRFETMLWNALDRRLQAECALSLGSLNTMLVIASTEHCRVYDIASALVITVGGASQAVDRLEAAGWCARQPNPADRRSSIVVLTERGEKLLAAGGAVFDAELEHRLREPLSATALGHLGRTLGTLRRAHARDEDDPAG